MVSPDQIRRTLRSIAQGRRADDVFGAISHGFKLNTAATDKELDLIEARFSCVLPPDYRSFLLQAGNGGAGPGYGLWPVGLWDRTNQHLEPIEPPAWPDTPKEPFPHVQHWNLRESHPGRPLAPDPTDEELDRHHQQRDRVTWAAGIANGALPIADLGCAIRLLLIVTGDERNNIWVDDRANDGGIYPASTPDHDRLTFAELYQDWLDQTVSFCDSGQRADRLW